MEKMTRQYAVKTNQSRQKDKDNWILQRTAVRSLPAKTLTPQTETPAGDRPGIKVDLMQIPNYSAKPSPLQADAKAHNSVAEETQSQQVQSLGTKGMPVAQGDDGLRDRETPVGRQEQEKKAENKTGLPDRLKEGIESMSGYDLSGVRVNYNSPKPAQLNAHAYTQGHAIEVAPGQERHLPHEAWHVVQQMQGRVTPTMEVNGYAVNGDRGLEREADEMGHRAVQRQKEEERKSGKGVEREKGKDTEVAIAERSPCPIQMTKWQLLTDKKGKLTWKFVPGSGDENERPEGVQTDKKNQGRIYDTKKGAWEKEEENPQDNDIGLEYRASKACVLQALNNMGLKLEGCKNAEDMHNKIFAEKDLEKYKQYSDENVYPQLYKEKFGLKQNKTNGMTVEEVVQSEKVGKYIIEVATSKENGHNTVLEISKLGGKKGNGFKIIDDPKNPGKVNGKSKVNAIWKKT